MRHILCLLLLTAFSGYQPTSTAASPLEKPEGEACVATGAFKLSPQRDFLTMEAQCGETTKEVRAPRLKEQPKIFRIPFKAAVVSIMGEEDDNVVLHVHYQAEDVHHMRSLPASNEGKYGYSFAELVPETVQPLPLTRK